MLRKSLPLLLVLTILLTLPAAVVNAQEIDGGYVNGHNITGKFWEFYNNTPEALTLFGYPITEAFVEQNHTVQYFQRARLDLIDGEIQIAKLGEYIPKDSAGVVPVVVNSTSCKRFMEGENVCYAFRQFYEMYDGEIYFGKAISQVEQQYVDGPYVQYFEKALMEWHPEAAEGQKVVLKDLGRMYFDVHNNNPALLASVDMLFTHIPVVVEEELQANAFISSSLATAGSEQTVYVILQNAQFQPVANAQTSIVLQYPNGDPSGRIVLDPTNENGISTYTFTIPEFDVDELILVEATVQYNGQEVTTTTWMRIWW